jgi:inosine-uridine nucleoside N-ribohydrolase
MKKQKTNAIPVLIDNDAGADDYFALLRSMIQHKKGNIDIVALTTAGGNVKAQCTFDNNIRASMMMDIDVPIGKGTDPV